MTAGMVLPPGAPRTQWLRERKSSIGGSEAAAIAGLNKYCSPYELWLLKTGRSAGIAETPKMRAGNLLEPVTVDMFAAETGLPCEVTGMWRPHNCKWEHANPDRFIGADAGLECKATFDFAAKDYADGPTPHAKAQSQWYMHVTGRSRWYIAVLTDGWLLRWWWMERDDKLITILADMAATFWHENVLTDTPPPVDGSKYTTEAIKRLYGYSYQTGSVVIPGLGEMMRQRRELKAAIKHLQSELDPIENGIKAALGDYETGRDEHGSKLVSWSSQGGTSATRYLKDLTQ